MIDETTFSDGQRAIVQMVRTYVGCSLDNRADELRQLIARGVDNPATIIYKGRSTCGLFVLGIWHAVAIDHDLLNAKYVSGQAIGWVLRVAHDFNALRYPRRDGPPVPGAVMHYFNKGKNNDHVEFCLSVPEVSTSHGTIAAAWSADHAGGGRENCGVSEGTSDVLWNAGRPLQAWIDPDALLELNQ